MSQKFERKIVCDLDKIQSTDVLKFIRDTFTHSGIQIRIITRRETDSIRTNPSSNDKHCAKYGVGNYTNEKTKEKEELKTDLRNDSKSCKPPCTEQFLILRSKQPNDNLIDYYLQYQPQDIKSLIKKFDFQYTELEDAELVTLTNMIIDSRNVYSHTQNWHWPDKAENPCYLKTKLRVQQSMTR